MRTTAVALALLGLAMPAAAMAAGDPFAGTWESRVAIGAASYTMRLRCMSASDCEMQMIDAGTAKGKPEDSTIPFRAARPLPGSLGPVRNALRYALEHRADSAKTPEFAAMHKLLAATVDAKTEIDTCIGLDDKTPEYFVVCTVRGATTRRPMLLLFGSLLGPCRHGFCAYVVYPLMKTGSNK